MSKRIVFIFGTRPELIKLYPLYQQFISNDACSVQLCSTGQHREMLDALADSFNISIDYNLSVMQENQDLAGLSSRLILSLNALYKKNLPDQVIVQGDTTTAFIAALSASYLKIPVAHVEAGLRTGDFNRPFPEERNRVLLSKLADLHFAPTAINKYHLLEEGICEDKIFVTGNTGIDTLLNVSSNLEWQSKWSCHFKSILTYLNQSDSRIVLITGHRRESFGDGFKNICAAILSLARRYPNIQFVYPVHLNPNVQKPVHAVLGNTPNIHLLPPLDYHPFVYLMKKSYLILTDSGGIQEEAPSLGKPVLVMREKTERVEAIEAGTAKLVGTDPDAIVSNTVALLEDKNVYQQMSEAKNPYGDGNASKHICQILKRELNLTCKKTESVVSSV